MSLCWMTSVSDNHHTRPTQEYRALYKLDISLVRVRMKRCNLTFKNVKQKSSISYGWRATLPESSKPYSTREDIEL